MDFRRRVFPITCSLWLGPFASPERRPVLVAAGVTHLLNVGEAPSVLSTTDGPFREVAWHPVADLERIPDESASSCLKTLHRMVCEPDARVYVHCVAGWNYQQQPIAEPLSQPNGASLLSGLHTR